MSELELLPLRVIPKAHGGNQVGTRGHGWPWHTPDADANRSLNEAMEEVKEVVDLTDAELGDQVGTLTVEEETRMVTDWDLEEQYRDD